MTLNEYITQSEPQANVKVILKEGEYIQRNAIKVTPFSVQTTVDFPARRCPGTARTFSIHAIPKGGYGILRTMGKREPATGGFAGT